MHSIANIVVASSDQAFAKNFASKLEDNNYRVTKCDTAKNLLEEAKTKYPDLVVIDCSDNGLNGFEITTTLKSTLESQNIPVVLLAKDKTEELFEKAIDVHADDVFLHTGEIEEFLTHIKPLLRLSTMFLELDNRVSLAVQEGIPASNQIEHDDNQPYNILLVAPKDGDKALIETILGGNCTIDVTNDFFDAEDRLGDGMYDAVLCDLSKEQQEEMLSLSSRVRNNPRLFNLPLIALSDGQLNSAMDAYRRGVTRIVKRPINQSSLKAKLKMLVRRQRLRWNIRKAIDVTKADKLTDSQTSAYTLDFFEANLKKQVDNAHKWQKPLAAISFSISNLQNVKEQFGKEAAQQLGQQVYQWISSLTRVEDTIARANEKTFTISLPDTPIEEAQIVMHRIAGILSYTDFAIDDVFQPLSVWVESGISSLEVGDDAGILIKRTQSNID